MTREELKTKIAELKAQIKHNASTGRDYRQEARKMLAVARKLRQENAANPQIEKLTEANKLTRDALGTREGAQSRGVTQRECLLAYGYLRGRKYRTIEQKTRMSDWQAKCLASAAARFAGASKDAIALWMESDVTCFDIDPCLSEMLKLREAAQAAKDAERKFSDTQQKILSQQKEIDTLASADW